MGQQCSSLQEVRAFLAEKGSSSHTTDTYQADIFQTMISCLDAGNCVIEVGTFMGGLSCQLAFLLENTGKDLVLIDISQDYLGWTKSLIQELGISTSIIGFVGTFQQFIEQHPEIQPGFIVIDGDHAYEGVVQDIQAAKRLNHQPAAIAFHDFSLRYCGSEASRIRVDKAIVDEYLSQGYRYKEIGATGTDSGITRISNVSASGNYHYHDHHCNEGLLVVTNESTFLASSPWMFQKTQTLPNLGNALQPNSVQILQSEFNELFQKLRQTEKKIKRLQSDLRQVKQEKDEAIDRITAMETSKFWKIRKQWFQFKKLVGLSSVE